MAGSRFLAVVLVGVIGSTAAADPEVTPNVTQTDADRATKLFEEGRNLAKQGDYVAACDRFQQSLDLDPGALGTALNLADCYEKRAQTAKAWHLFDKVARRASHDADQTRAKFARDRADKLVIQLVAVDAHVAELPDGFAMTINGQPVSQIGAEIQDVADPGAIVVEATAPNHPAFHAELRGAAGSTVRVDVSFNGLSSAVAPPQIAPVGTHRRGGWVAGAFIAGGAGAAAVLVGLGFGYEARSDHQQLLADGDCREATGLECSPAGATKEHHAANLADVSTGLTVGGLALVAGGVALFMLAPQDREQKDHIGVGPIVTSQQIGVALGGRF